MKNKLLKNHKLINFLVDHRKISLVSVNKTHIVCTLSPKFTPEDVEPLCSAIGQWPLPRKSGDNKYIVFERFPDFGKKEQQDNGN